MSYRRPPMEIVVVVSDGPAPPPLPAGWRIVGRRGSWWLVERPDDLADELVDDAHDEGPTGAPL